MENESHRPESETATEAGPRLRRLKIHRFPNLAAGTELTFDDGINVLLGRNGTGKTTLLDFISALVRNDIRAYEQQTFDVEYEMSVGDTRIEVHIENAPRKFAANVRENLRTLVSNTSFWTYKLRISDASGLRLEASMTPQGLQYRLPGSPSFESKHRPNIFSKFLLSDILLQLLEDTSSEWITDDSSKGFTNTFPLNVTCYRLDEGLDSFRSLIEGEPSDWRPVALIESVTANESLDETPQPHIGLTQIENNTYIPRAILERFEHHPLTDTNTKTLESRDITFLAVLARALRAKDVHLTLHLLDRIKERTATRSRFGRPLFRITTKTGHTFTQSDLSYGEKRLLMFLYHAATNPEILIADELVNGLHYEWINTCLDAIEGQAFLTSQNPLLLDHLQFSSPEEVQRRFILCERDDDDGSWTWRNMSEEDAAAVHRALEVGIQHVGEILESKGLW